jgi:hypothetical protein
MTKAGITFLPVGPSFGEINAARAINGVGTGECRPLMFAVKH